MNDDSMLALIDGIGWPQVNRALLILLVGWAVIRVSAWALPRLAERVPGRYRLRVLAVVPILRLASIAVMATLIIPIFVPPTRESIIALLGASGILIGFALKDYASSLIAGVVTLIEQPYKPGDWIQYGGHYGEVAAIGLRTVTLVTPDDDTVVIPHDGIWRSPVVNANAGARELQCAAEFCVAHPHEGALVRRVLRDTALASPYSQVSKPVAVVAAEHPWGTLYRLKAYPVDAREQFRFKTDLTLRGRAALQAVGVLAPALSVSAASASPGP